MYSFFFINFLNFLQSNFILDRWQAYIRQTTATSPFLQLPLSSLSLFLWVYQNPYFYPPTHTQPSWHTHTQSQSSCPLRFCHRSPRNSLFCAFLSLPFTNLLSLPLIPLVYISKLGKLLPNTRLSHFSLTPILSNARVSIFSHSHPFPVASVTLCLFLYFHFPMTKIVSWVSVPLFSSA